MTQDNSYKLINCLNIGKKSEAANYLVLTWVKHSFFPVSIVKQIVQMCKFALSSKPGIFYSLPQWKLSKPKQQKKSPHYSWGIDQEKIATKLTRYYGRLFELKILEILTTAFLLRTWTLVFFKYCWVLSLKTKKKS